MRKLASIRKIVEVKTIEGATAIEAVRVDGWWVVCKKNEFMVGDLVVYFEIDSWIPHEIAPFLSKDKEPREYGGVKGERLRTVKLRGQISQGLILPLETVSPAVLTTTDPDKTSAVLLVEGTDVTNELGVQLWERPVHPQLMGIAKGNFPNFIPKTDQERIQNKFYSLIESDIEAQWQVTTKLDGSSMTVYWHEGRMGVCSRNIDLKLEAQDNTFVNTAKKVFGDRSFPGLAIQGELMGPGIQGNREDFKEFRFFVFDIYDIRYGKYWEPKCVEMFCEAHELEHVPVLGYTSLVGVGLEDILNSAETPSIKNPIAEGVVYKREDAKDSFKAISNWFLLREK